MAYQVMKVASGDTKKHGDVRNMLIEAKHSFAIVSLC